MRQKRKLKIGLMFNTNRSLQDWEINLFENLLNSEFCEIKLIISSNEKKINKDFTSNLINKLSKGNLLYSIISKFIRVVEKKFIKKTRKSKETKLLNKLNNIKILKPNYEKKKYVDIFFKK